MKKTYLLAAALCLSVGVHAQTQTQSLNILKSILKDKTGIDVDNVNKTTTSTNNTGATSSTPIKTSTNLGNLTSTEISSGLKQALNLGVTEGVSKLGVADGFYKNDLVKILMPEKLRKIDTTLRSIGLGSLADKGVLMLNRAAEDAVKEAAPIFATAITSMTITDAKNILLGSNNAATSYLQTKTQSQLFTAFQPKVQASLGKVGADTVWKNIITKYNTFTGQEVTTDLNEYVTTETINGVFKMVAEKEDGIRNNSVMRTTSLLEKVFGAQDKK